MASLSCSPSPVARLLFVVIAVVLLSTLAEATAEPAGVCERKAGECHDTLTARRLKIIAIFAILVASMVGVCLPLVTRSAPVLSPDGNVFAIVKAFSSGVILATGFMHVLPDSFNNLTSQCLPGAPWRNFPFTTFVAMLSAVFTLMVDSFATSLHGKVAATNMACEMAAVGDAEAGAVTAAGTDKDRKDQKLLRHRIVAQVLELGIVVHSVVIGLSLGASDNPCTIRPLVAALCFHQLFEGMGLGGCILQADYKLKAKAIMAFFFSVTTPFGVAMGIGLSNVYSDTSPTALIVQGLLNACSAGLLNYMALVDLLAADFLGPKLQGNLKLQFEAYMAVFLGCGGMSFMAKWA
ncbi:fe(2+) transport protein 2-like [Nymphaea colorata]|nr:fe(2+) transport protein 2-like [Nymphaea colorata]